MRKIGNEPLVGWAVFVIINNIATCDITKSNIKPSFCFPDPSCMEEAKLLRNELSGIFCQEAEHFQMHPIVKVEYHAIGGHKKTNKFLTDFCKGIVFNPGIINEKRGKFIKQNCFF